MKLRRCTQCRRHVRAEEAQCPFCAIEHRARVVVTAVTVGSTLFGCSARDLSPVGDATESTSTSASTTNVVETSIEPTTEPGTTIPGTTSPSETGPMSSTGIGDSSTSEDEAEGGCNAGFYGGCPPDSQGLDYECDVWAQDCPRGEKCMPWANDGGSSWNSTRCSPLDPMPAQVGDPCQVEGSGVSGIDNCALGAMCWNVDADTNTGTCVDFCSGSEANPECEDVNTACAVFNDGVLILCLALCDPLMQACAEGEACYPLESGFHCLPAVDPQGGHGTDCAVVNACSPGFFCADGTSVFGCESAGCCTEFCDLDAADPNAVCSGLADGETCTALFDHPDTPPDLEDVGACVLPG